MPTKVTIDSYPALLTRIRAEIKSGRVTIENARAATYWKIGKHIQDDILKHKKRAGYGQKLFAKLSKDLDVSKRTIERAVQFHREFPIATPVSQLSWAHYVDLLTVSNKIQRRQLEKRAVIQGLSRRQLQKEIVSLKKKHPAARKEAPAAAQAAVKLKPRKGILSTYKVEEAGADTVYLDLGFNVTRRYPIESATAKLASGDIVEAPQKGNAMILARSKRTAKDLYFYKAQVTKVIDGDTLWVKIRLGFNTFVRQKLRLRGLDAPEIDTPEGKRAKRFVQKTLGGVEYILIRTSTTDKYDRYLADVFYGKDETFLNQQLLDEGLAVGYKE